MHKVNSPKPPTSILTLWLVVLFTPALTALSVQGSIWLAIWTHQRPLPSSVLAWVLPLMASLIWLPIWGLYVWHVPAHAFNLWHTLLLLSLGVVLGLYSLSSYALYLDMYLAEAFYPISQGDWQYQELPQGQTRYTYSYHQSTTAEYVVEHIFDGQKGLPFLQYRFTGTRGKGKR